MLHISQEEFNAIRTLMYKKTGVHLKDTKKPLVISRLRKRLEELGLAKFQDYTALLQKTNSEELEYFINAITTNETFFFRHMKQFDLLKSTVLPDVMSKKGALGKKDIKLWSGASSTGEEPYTLAIVMKEYLRAHPGWRFTLYASDVNSNVLRTAREGLYNERSVKDVPPPLLKKYFQETVADGKLQKTMYRVTTELKTSITYLQHNLLHQFRYADLDIIFLRNVLI